MHWSHFSGPRGTLHMRNENMAKNTGKCPPIAKIFVPYRKFWSPMFLFKLTIN